MALLGAKKAGFCFRIALVAELFCFYSTGSYLLAMAYGVTVYLAIQILKFGTEAR